MDFWLRLDRLVASRRIVIDRPKGTAHPRYPELIYPLDYGYLEGTSGADGNEIDIWQGSQSAKSLIGIACTVDTLKKDAELKILISCGPDDINQVREFYDKSEYLSGIVILRNNPFARSEG